jgi:hypothetical protein
MIDPTHEVTRNELHHTTGRDPSAAQRPGGLNRPSIFVVAVAAARAANYCSPTTERRRTTSPLA